MASSVRHFAAADATHVSAPEAALYVFPTSSLGNPAGERRIKLSFLSSLLPSLGQHIFRYFCACVSALLPVVCSGLGSCIFTEHVLAR